MTAAIYPMSTGLVACIGSGVGVRADCTGGVQGGDGDCAFWQKAEELAAME